MKVVLPVVEQRFQQFVSDDGHGGADENKARQGRLDAIEWSLMYSKEDKKTFNPRWIALSLIHNLWAGSAAPGGLVTQMCYQVLFEPEYLDPLRTEAERALEDHGGYTDKALSSMVYMDSFIHEITRLYPTGAVTCARSVMDEGGFTFHDGFTLPRGSRVAIPALAIQTDADNFEEADSFDGFRYVRKQGQENDEDGDHKGSASTVTETNLA